MLITAGCGSAKPPPEAENLIREAASELKGGETADFHFELNQDQVTATAKYPDGSSETWKTVKDAGDWILKGCEAADDADLTEHCLPRQQSQSSGSDFVGCLTAVGFGSDLWRNCSPLADPTTKDAASASWRSCLDSGGDPVFCALRLDQVGP